MVGDDTTRITVVAAPAARRGRGRRVAVVLGAVVLLLVLVVAGAVYALSESLGNNVDRVPGAFVGLDESARPVATDAVTFLLSAPTPAPTPPLPARTRAGGWAATAATC